MIVPLIILRYFLFVMYKNKTTPRIIMQYVVLGFPLIGFDKHSPFTIHNSTFVRLRFAPADKSADRSQFTIYKPPLRFFG